MTRLLDDAAKAARLLIAAALLWLPATPAEAASTAVPAAPQPENISRPLPPDPRWQTIVLTRHGATAKDIAVTFGIPFPPGALRSARDVRIVDEQGRSIPAHVRPSLRWHARDDSIRAVQVQLRTRMEGRTRTLHFALGPAEADSIAGWPYADDLIENANGVAVPGVLATLTPQWMSASLVAGPQRPAIPESAYDRYFATQFTWASALPRNDGSAWLFDRPTTLFQQYVRTGRTDYLAAAIESYRFYMGHLQRTGLPGWPLCAGGWIGGKVNACDSKYVYIEPILLALALTGDDSEHDTALIDKMVGAWDSGGWSFSAGPYLKPEQHFTEREAGLGLLATVAAYEITGDARYRKRIDDRVGWLYQHQQHNPDGLGNDGSWRHSWQVHEGDTYNAKTDVRGASPWMSENIIDALWHAWLVTGDPRIPTMITGFGRYMEQHGWIDQKTVTQGHPDWRDPCSGSGGQISWYWSSAHASRDQLIAIESSDGWYSDAHNVELTLPVAAARYFETDPVQQQALDRRLARLASSYNLDCAANKATARRFNWNNRGVGVVQWFLGERGTGNGEQGTDNASRRPH